MRPAATYDYFCAQRIAKLAHAKTVFELRETWPELQRELYPAEDSRLISASRSMPWAMRCAGRYRGLLPAKGEDYCRQRRSPRPTWLPCRRPLRRGHLPSPCGKPTLGLIRALRGVIPLSPPTPGTSMTGICRKLLVGAAGSLREQGIAAVIAGNGGDKQLLRRVIRENNWENILLLDAQSERRQRTLYGLADILYYGDDRRCDAPYGPYTPLLLRMMQNEKPILTVTHSPFNDAQRAGCAVPPGR